MQCFHTAPARLGNALGMIGVTSGIAATIGLLQPSPEVRLLKEKISCMKVCRKHNGIKVSQKLQERRYKHWM